MLNRGRAGIKSSLVICLCHQEGSRMPALGCPRCPAGMLRTSGGVGRWQSATFLPSPPMCCLWSLQWGLSQPAQCSHPDLAFVMVCSQDKDPSTWGGFGMVFFHCLQLCLQLQLLGTLLPLSWSLIPPRRVMWNTVKQKSTLYPLYPDVVTAQSPQKQRTSTPCSEK